MPATTSASFLPRPGATVLGIVLTLVLTAGVALGWVLFGPVAFSGRMLAVFAVLLAPFGVAVAHGWRRGLRASAPSAGVSMAVRSAAASLGPLVLVLCAVTLTGALSGDLAHAVRDSLALAFAGLHHFGVLLVASSGLAGYVFWWALYSIHHSATHGLSIPS